MPTPTADQLRRRNRRFAIGIVAVVAGMAGLARASVPLYTLFCAATGYNGTTKRGGQPPGPRPDAGALTVRFMATTQPNLPWHFAAEQPSMRVLPGESNLAFYGASNTAATPVTGTALYNVTPDVVGRYFHKTACFCFEEQTLQPGEAVQMPVTFWVDPAIATDPNTRDIRTITLSYSFYRTLEDAARSGALAVAGPHVGPLVRPPG